ncbi:MAG: hypothetical protein Q9201_005074 [Fulgogasparrea decipioides]
MSGPHTPSGRPPATMSSRLLAMKFMQRAAASASPTTPQTPDGPPSKRQKISNDQTPSTTPTVDAEAYQAAVDAEDAKRAAAIERMAAEAGETKWVLSTAEAKASNGTAKGTERKLRFLTAGYSDIDQGITTVGRQDLSGRRSFGRFNKDLEKQQHGTTDSDSSSSSFGDDREHGDTYSKDEGTDDDTDPTAALIRQSREEALRRTKAEAKAKKKAEKAGKAERALEVEDRRGRVVKLNKLSSISGGNDRGRAEIECHFCGQKGHMKRDCPKKAKIKRQKLDRPPEELEY